MEGGACLTCVKKHGYAEQHITYRNHYAIKIVKIELTDKGREAKQKGGHFAYMDYIGKRDSYALSKEKFSALSTEYAYKTRFIPHIVSLFSL